MIFIFLRYLAVCNTEKDISIIIIIILYFCKPRLAKNSISFEIKTIKNKLKGCLPNTPLNQRNLNKKQQTKQGLMTDPI